MHNSSVGAKPHFGARQKPSELVTSFQGERDLSHTLYRPAVVNEGVGNLWDDISSSLQNALQQGASAAGGSIIGDIAQTPEAQEQAKKAGFEAAVDWLSEDNRWAWVLGGTAAAGVGITVLTMMVLRGMKKRR